MDGGVVVYCSMAVHAVLDDGSGGPHWIRGSRACRHAGACPPAPNSRFELTIEWVHAMNS
jgi:hypothetical protein